MKLKTIFGSHSSGEPLHFLSRKKVGEVLKIQSEEFGSYFLQINHLLSLRNRKHGEGN